MFAKISIVISALIFGACAAPPQYNWVKTGVTNTDRDTAVSECQYQIKLNKTDSTHQSELLKLCMQGKGFRLRQVN
ncbi:MAG: hypothetical protein QM533_08830 [Cytophagales bacterium]|nr:hypothetical protein [Cytophagales bacterium]